MLINEGLASELAVASSYITSEIARQLSEIKRRRRVYLGDKPPPALAGRTIIIVDDGIAAGSTARAALRAVRKAGARRIVLAVPRRRRAHLVGRRRINPETRKSRPSEFCLAAGLLR